MWKWKKQNMYVSYPRFPDIRSASCNLKNFPSAFSHTVSPYTGRSLFIVGWRPKTSFAMWKLDGISPYFYGQPMQAEEKCVKMNIWIFTQWLPYLELLMDPSRTQIYHGPSLCELLQPFFCGGPCYVVLTAKTGNKLFQVNDYVLFLCHSIQSVFVWLCLFCVYACMYIWCEFWRRLIKYSPPA